MDVSYREIPKAPERFCTSAEGSIAEEYICAESLFYANEYSLQFHEHAQRLLKPTEEDARCTGVVLPKRGTQKRLSRILREQAHRFLVLNAPCMARWRASYEQAFRASTSKPSIEQWILPTIQAEIVRHASVTQMELDIAVGPGENADFYSICWAYGRHFRVMTRDVIKTTTCDCGISAIYEMAGKATEYFGYVDSILRLNFDSFETVLFKGMFWDSVIKQNGPNLTVLQDECGVDRVKTAIVLSDSDATDEPFVFPKDVNQVLYVDDNSNPGWKLVVKVNPRSNLVVYKRAGPAAEDASRDDGYNHVWNFALWQYQAPRRVTSASLSV